MTRLPARLLGAFATLVLLALAPPARAQGVPPDARWRTMETEHFRVHFTPGIDVLGRRAALRAEAAYAGLRESFVEPPRGKIDLVISDNVDYANGYATPFPTNRIVIFAHAPVDDPELSFFDDWLQLVITHELVHVFHLDYARGPLRSLRSLLGRTPYSFPNAATPPWFIEGVATYLESRLTQAGRVRGTIHEMEIRTAVLQDEFFSIDRATGYPRDWPAGATRYVYGSMFLDWLGRRRGHEAAGAFVREIGGNVVPYLVDQEARDAYGVSFTRAWEEWETELKAGYRALADSLRRAGITEPEVLTPAGRRTEFPRHSPDGRWIAFAQATGRSEPATKLLGMDGRVRALDGRTSLGPVSWRPDGRGMVTSMLEARDPYRYYADLYSVDLDGDKDRMTTGARLMHADVARDGRIVAVRADSGAVALVVRDASGGGERVLAAAETDVFWAHPRWSPDGRTIAVARWVTGGYYDVVVVDAGTGAVARELTRDRAVDTAPAWSPDGRQVVFSSDRSGIPNLYAYDLQAGTLFQVTNVLTGAFQPDVSPDGRSVVFAYYQADGYHVARFPFDPATWRPAPPVRPEAAGPGAAPEAIRQAWTGPDRPYSPWRSLRPAAWSPIFVSDDDLGTGLGAATGGTDVIGRHTWGAFALLQAEARFEGSLAYLYRGLGDPVLGASLSQDWDVLVGRRPGGVPATALLERERSAALVATFTRPRFRSYGWVSLGADLRDRDREWDNPEAGGGIDFIQPPPEAGAVLTLGYSTTRAYDFSISAENGFLTAVSVQGRRFLEALEGEDGTRGYTRVTGRAQGYLPFPLSGYARHVLAARVAAGLDFGSRTPGYWLGGEGPLSVAYPLSTATGIGGTPDFPVRGYDEGAQFGDRVVAGSLEWRFPLLRVERGWRVLPLFLDRFWGTAFADGGTAWCVEYCFGAVDAANRGQADFVYSVGAELGVDLSFGYVPTLGLRIGAAFPLAEVDYGGTVGSFRPDPKVYIGAGRSF